MSDLTGQNPEIVIPDCQVKVSSNTYSFPFCKEKHVTTTITLSDIDRYFYQDQDHLENLQDCRYKAILTLIPKSQE